MIFVLLSLVLVIFLAPLVAVGIALVVAVVIWVLISRGATNAALRSLNARPLDDAAHPRLESLVESICASHGIGEPVLYASDSRAIDIAVVGRPDDTRLVVTTGALRQLDRLELEAIIARQMSLFGRGIASATMLVGVSKWIGPLAAPLRTRLLDDRRLARADLDGARLTRYPPALAASLSKALNGARVATSPVSDHLWLIGSETSVQPDLIERIDTLNEL